MCRLFGLLGTAAAPPEPWLVSTDRSLLAQSNTSEENAQRDGWGVGWYDRSRSPRVELGVGGAFEPTETARYKAAARRAIGPVVLAHLRHASNPMGLPRDRLIGLENCQPFAHGGAMFIHNGMIALPRETRSLLGKYEERLRGVNDSEVLFWLLIRHLEELGDPLPAYARTVEDLRRVWAKAGRVPSHPYSGLNVIFTRGPNELWAFCHWLGDHGSSFYDPVRPYYQMAYLANAKHLLAASEPFDSSQPDWRSLANGEYLRGRLTHGLVSVETGPVPFARAVSEATTVS